MGGNKIIQDGGYAFPVSVAVSPSDTVVDSTQIAPGMTLRDYFANAAMKSILLTEPRLVETNKVASWAYEMADAMISERKK